MSSFKLKSGDSSFNSRVDALFSSLQTVAVDLEPQLKRSFDEISDDKEDDSAGNDGDRGEFRRPQGTGLTWRGRGRGRGLHGPRNDTPDYVKNPQKWTKYSMKDTKVLINRENQQVGLKLFDELRTRRAQEDDDVVEEGASDDGCSKIVFKKPTKSSDDDDDDKDDEDDAVEENPAAEIFGGAKKIRLREYEVGKPNRKKNMKKTTTTCAGGDKTEKEASGKEVKLGHLMYEEEDE
ncbi:protein TSSC4-like [Homarus americanus]|uniref:U5 small nuclear ribonucleoprotein TSSC4 n=1 Tax=Homarus americanus TaxID=6706 RepID=A0A8J5N1U2_HOMAM|nr:protein TSSC4-like [Homarus americanus]KAG7171624.1 TSSC4-like [Homarus americanus]